jgi:hypothetical protein
MNLRSIVHFGRDHVSRRALFRYASRRLLLLHLASTGMVLPTKGNNDAVLPAEWNELIRAPNGFILPENHGAVGDGTTDDSAAFQAALDAARDNGQVVLVLGAAYKAFGLSMERGVILEGLSRRGTVIQSDSVAGRNILRVKAGSGEEDVAIRDLELRLRHSGDVGIFAENMTQGLVENVRLYNNEGGELGTGVHLRASAATSASVYRNLFQHVRAQNLALGLRLEAVGNNGPNANAFNGFEALSCTNGVDISAACFANVFTSLRAERGSGNTGTAVKDRGTRNQYLCPYIEFWNIGFDIQDAVQPVIIGGDIANIATKYSGAATRPTIIENGGIYQGASPLDQANNSLEAALNVQDVLAAIRNIATGNTVNTAGLHLRSKDSAGAEKLFGYLVAKSLGITPGSENGELGLGTYRAGTLRDRIKVKGGHVILDALNAAPTDADLLINQVAFYVDETNNQLKVRVRYTDGTYRTGTLAALA